MTMRWEAALSRENGNREESRLVTAVSEPALHELIADARHSGGWHVDGAWQVILYESGGHQHETGRRPLPLREDGPACSPSEGRHIAHQACTDELARHGQTPTEARLRAEHLLGSWLNEDDR